MGPLRDAAANAAKVRIATHTSKRRYNVLILKFSGYRKQEMPIRKILAHCAAATLLCATGWAQSPAPAATQKTPTFTSGINLVSVPVVVRDQSGKAVGNLTKDRFQRFDKGKRQEITAFSVEKTQPPEQTPGQPQHPEHFIAYLFD